MNAGKLWAGGLAAAVVAALSALVGYMIVEGLFDTEFVSPELGRLGDSQLSSLVLHAAIAALLATGLIHLLLATTPRALSFFHWIGGLVTAGAVLWPFTVDVAPRSQIASAIVYLVVGLAVISLVGGVARSAQQPAPAPPTFNG